MQEYQNFAKYIEILQEYQNFAKYIEILQDISKFCKAYQNIARYSKGSYKALIKAIILHNKAIILQGVSKYC